MNKKQFSKRNPHGVKYPEAVTVDGKFVYAVDIEKGSEIWEGVKFYFPGCEADDDEEMVFVQRHNKNGVTHFFRHKPGYLGGSNEKDRYLHNYAELKIKQRFDESLQSGEFLVQYYAIKKCPQSSTCKLRTNLECKGKPVAILMPMNLRKLYDTCSVEKSNDKYIADLLLTNSKDQSIKPMFLEVFVTHKCTEEKINSGYPIIEIKINRKEDADNPIIENSGDIVDEYMFLQPENQEAQPLIKFYGFDREVSYSDYTQYGNFLLTKNVKELVADCRVITCDVVDKLVPENLVLSLSVPLNELKEMDLYEIGMAIAHNMGLNVKDCSICSSYKQQFRRVSFGRFVHPCRLENCTYQYKDAKGNDKIINNPYIYQIPYRCNGFDKAQMAAGCSKYSIDRKRISDIVDLLEKMKNKSLWVDKSLLLHESVE